MHVKGLAQDQTQATAYHSLVMVGNITQILWPSVILTIRKKKMEIIISLTFTEEFLW